MKLSRSTNTRSLLAVAIIVAFAWLPIRGQQHNLDSYDNATLDRDLEAELDDLYTLLPNRDGLAALEILHDDILQVLQDDNDDDNEDDIDFEDLDAEVQEDGMSIDDVIDRGLEEADDLASLRAPVTLLLARLAAPPQRGDDRTTPRLAVRQVKGSFIRAIRDVRRE